ncbi:MAG: metal-sensitive transcriptional regulator [Deltaproteobacteria bacterium]|nr:metal-sensitive transcriptional regulator [Deltaproteobacteria bacterium]
MANGRKGVIVPLTRTEAAQRLSRIEGQVKGIKKMVEQGRYCVEVLGQISAVHEALRGVGKLIMRNYLENCVTSSLRSGKQRKARETYAELMDVVYKFAK